MKTSLDLKHVCKELRPQLVDQINEFAQLFITSIIGLYPYPNSCTIHFKIRRWIPDNEQAAGMVYTLRLAGIKSKSGKYLWRGCDSKIYHLLFNSFKSEYSFCVGVRGRTCIARSCTREFALGYLVAGSFSSK